MKKGNVGTKHFRAPETYPEIPEGEIPEGQQFSYDPTKADIYSLACTVMIMLTGLKSWYKLQIECPEETEFH